MIAVLAVDFVRSAVVVAVSNAVDFSWDAARRARATRPCRSSRGRPLSGDLSAEEEEALINLGHLVRAGDGAIKTLLEATNRRLTRNEGPFLDQWDFVARLRDIFPEASEFGTHSGQLFDEMKASGLGSPQDVEHRVLGGDREGAHEHGMRTLNAVRDFLIEQGDDVVQLDERTSDVLLMLYLDQHAAQVLDRHPAGRGRGRPPRIASVARRFGEWESAQADERSAEAS